MSGFTLLELLIAISVAAIALAIAVPSFTGIITSNRLSATANELIGSLHQARMQAIKRNLPAQFCSDAAALNGTDTLGAACNSTAGAVYLSGVSDPIATAPQIPDSIMLTNVTALRFAGNGLASTATGSGIYSGLIADIYTPKVETNNHRCIYMITGSVISSCKITANSGGCPSNEPATCQQQ
jgi:type IV fimbrial biogenesis protein FimT